MCYSAKDSIIAYIIGCISNIYLFTNSKNTDEKILSLFLLFVSHMQLFDYIFWKNKECNKTNKNITKIAIIFNHLQPIILYLLLKLFNNETNMGCDIIFYIFLIIIILYTINIWPNKKCTDKEITCCSLPLKEIKNNTIIKWDWNHRKYAGIVYLIFLISLVVSSLQLKNINIMFAFANIFTFLISTKIPNLNRSFGRLWCFIASLFTTLYLIYSRLFKG
jgi:hypothetical protein